MASHNSATKYPESLKPSRQDDALPGFGAAFCMCCPHSPLASQCFVIFS